MALTKTELQEALDAAGIEYPDDAKKADLEALMPDEEPPAEPVEEADYRILVAAGPMSGLEGTITMARDEGDGWVQLGWLEPVKAE